MVTFLFWNLKKQPLQSLLASIAHAKDVDVLILAECDTSYADLVTALNHNKKRKYGAHQEFTTSIKVLSRFPYKSIKPVSDHGRVSIRELVLPIGPELLLVLAHLPSKLHQTDGDQAHLAVRIRDQIEAAEKKVGHKRTVVIGDFNMNPFEQGLVSSEAFHAVMCREVAAKQTRIVQQEDRHFFYNPMWGHFGRKSKGPPGTYYHNHAGPINYFWNMFDQVLLRPDLLPYFNDDDLEIITDANGTPLITMNGIPDDKAASDHLPIVFSLNI